MKSSILRNLNLSFLAFGTAMGLGFPVYAQFFVEWKEGLFLWFVLGCVVAGISIGIVNYQLCKVILLRKLTRISDVAKSISNNDISFSCTMESNDLVGEIIQSTNMMTNNLRLMIGRIAAAAAALEKETHHLSELSSRTSTNAEQQSLMASQVNRSAEEIRNGLKQISELAKEAAQSTQMANEQSRKGALISTDAIGSISNLARDLEKAAEVIRQLDSKSTKISTVMDVIRGIAEQTNLLALNAAIEAARAGEQGRGFAVVADEVRTLATRTQQSTSEIEDMVEELQRGSHEAVEAMEKARSQASSTESRFEEAAELLAEISGVINAISSMSSQFANSAEQHCRLIDVIVDNLSGMNQINQTALDDAETAASTSKNVKTQVTDLNRIVGEFRH